MKPKKMRAVLGTLGVAVLAAGAVFVSTGTAGARDSHAARLHTELLSDSQSLVKTPTNNGYWLVTADGQVYTFGSAKSYGTLPTSHITPNKPIVGMVATSTAKGYWLVGSDGGVFSFGAAKFFGSKGGTKINSPVVGMTALPARGIEWDGNYNATTTYTKGDAVSQGGSTYVSLRTANVGNTPGTALTVNWALVSAKGTTGPAGATGATGPTGTKGTTGPAGPKGTKGTTGPAGPKGTKGTTGPAGPKGTKGTTGPAGPKGTTGPAGPKGTPGVGYEFTTATGTSVEVHLTGGTYFVDVEFAVTAVTDGTTGITGDCRVHGRSASSTTAVGAFAAAVVRPASSGEKHSISGILHLDESATRLVVGCTKLTGQTLPISNVHWWYSPIG